MPALFTTMSSLPECSCTAAIMAAIEAGLDMSAAEILDADLEFSGKFGPPPFDAGGIAEAVENDVRTGSGQSAGHADADAAAAGLSGDERDFSVQFAGGGGGAHGGCFRCLSAAMFNEARTPGEPAAAPVSAVKRPHMLWSLVSWRMSADSSTTGLSVRFFHQCDRTLHLRFRLARRVQDRHAAGAGVFDDLALDDIDDGWAVGVAMPGDDAARLDHQLAQPLQAASRFDRLFGEVDTGDHGVGDALRGCGHRLWSGQRRACPPDTLRPWRQRR